MSTAVGTRGLIGMGNGTGRQSAEYCENRPYPLTGIVVIRVNFAQGKKSTQSSRWGDMKAQGSIVQYFDRPFSFVLSTTNGRQKKSPTLFHSSCILVGSIRPWFKTMQTRNISTFFQRDISLTVYSCFKTIVEYYF